MSGSTALARMRRAFEFGRHIPMRQVARRVELQVKRTLRDRLGTIAWPRRDDIVPASKPPLPLFASRAGQADIGQGLLRFNFLNCAIDMGERVAWDAPGPGSGDQLWRMCLHYMEYLEALEDAS